MASGDASTSLENQTEDVKAQTPSTGIGNCRLDDVTSTLKDHSPRAQHAGKGHSKAEQTDPSDVTTKTIKELKIANTLLKQELADIKASLTEIKSALSPSNAAFPDGSDTWMIVNTGEPSPTTAG